MNTDQAALAFSEKQAEGQTLFDELAGLVPAERRAEYYRAIAHTRTLSPNEEMLRLLEAMGILALLTRERPADVGVDTHDFRPWPYQEISRLMTARAEARSEQNASPVFE